MPTPSLLGLREFMTLRSILRHEAMLLIGCAASLPLTVHAQQSMPGRADEVIE